MTPETLKSTCIMFRTELEHQGASMGIMSVFDSMCSYLGGESRDLNRALAALEEAQQQIKELQDGNRSACESREIAYRARNEAVITSNQHYKQLVETQQAAERVLKSHYYVEGKLAEAQQTIARQQIDTVEIVLLEMWLSAGFEEIYKYKNRIKVYQEHEGRTNYELFYDLTGIFPVVDLASMHRDALPEDCKVSIRELLADLGNKEGSDSHEPTADDIEKA